jgi:cell division septation protein DedD
MPTRDHDIEDDDLYEEGAEDEFEDYYDDIDDEPSGRGPLYALVAILLLVGVGAIAWFAYEEGKRAGMREAPPLLRSMTEAGKVEPDDPGGLPEPRDSEVYRELAGRDAHTPERIMPREETPAVVDTTPSPDRPGDGTAEALIERDVKPRDQVAVPPPSEALRERVGGIRSGPEGARAEAEAVEQTPATTQQPEVRPEARPQPTQPAPAETEVATQPETRPATTPPAVAADGNFVVQIAAFRSHEEALQGWRALENRHGELIGSRTRDIAEVDLGERGVFHRLRIGYFVSSEQATTFCNQLKARGQDCLVRTR